MPKVINGKRLTSHEHEIWRRAYESASRDPNIDNPGAVATAAVEKYRQNRKKKKKKGGNPAAAIMRRK